MCSVHFSVHFFDIKKVSQVYFAITYETISAERQGFEPWDQQAGQRFSRPPRSTTPASLQSVGFCNVFQCDMLKNQCLLTAFSDCKDTFFFLYANYFSSTVSKNTFHHMVTLRKNKFCQLKNIYYFCKNLDGGIRDESEDLKS